MLRQIGGNPGQVNAICQRVTPQLKSLWDLCSAHWQRLESVTTSVVRSMSFDFETKSPNIQNESRLMRRMSDDLDEHQSSLQLTRKPGFAKDDFLYFPNGKATWGIQYNDIIN